MAEYITELTDQEPRYVKRQKTVTAVQWNGTSKSGIKIIKALTPMFARVFLDGYGEFELELNHKGNWNRVGVTEWIVVGEYDPRLLRADYEVLTDAEFRRVYERLES